MAFDYYSPVTINAGQVPSAQTDFPVLISVTDARFKSVANGGHVKNSSGFDIRPYADSTLLTAIIGYELERYNGSTGEVIMWVKRSSVSDGLITYLAYGDASITTDGSSTTTWSNNFISVYHLKDGTTLSVADSLGTNNGINHGVTAVTGQVDGGGGFASVSNQYIDIGNTINPAAITFSAWVKATSFPFDYNPPISRFNSTNIRAELFAKSNGKLAIFFGNGSTILGYDGTGSHTLSTSTWYYLVAAYDSSAGTTAYVNASSDRTQAASGTLSTTPAVSIIGRQAGNNRYWDGVLDECRIASVARSADWVTTEYNNQSSTSTFETLGDEVSTTPIPPTPPEPIIVIPEERNVGGARGWKKRLLDEKLWMDKQDEMLLKIANEDDLEVVHVLTDFLSRV